MINGSLAGLSSRIYHNTDACAVKRWILQKVFQKYFEKYNLAVHIMERVCYNQQVELHQA